MRLLEVEATPASAGVDLAVGGAVWPAAVGEPLACTRPKIASNSASLMESVVMALACPGIETRPAPELWLVGEVKGQLSLTCTCAKWPWSALRSPKMSAKN